MNAAKTKQEIYATTEEAHNLVKQQYQQEVNYMNTTYANLDRYLEYAKGLRQKSDTGEGQSYLTDYEKSLTSAGMVYDRLFDLQPQGYQTEKGEQGLGFIDWMKSQVSTEEDQAWFDWLTLGGGYDQVKEAALTGIDFGEAAEQHAKGQEALEKQRAEETVKYNIVNQAEPNDIKAADIRWNDFWEKDAGMSYEAKIDKRVMPGIEQYMTDVGVSKEDITAYLKENPITWEYAHEYTHTKGYHATKSKTVSNYKELIDLLYARRDGINDETDFENYYRQLTSVIRASARKKYFTE
jgi:hypothetical protein